MQISYNSGNAVLVFKAHKLYLFFQKKIKYGHKMLTDLLQNHDIACQWYTAVYSKAALIQVASKKCLRGQTNPRTWPKLGFLAVSNFNSERYDTIYIYITVEGHSRQKRGSISLYLLLTDAHYTLCLIFLWLYWEAAVSWLAHLAVQLSGPSS